LTGSLTGFGTLCSALLDHVERGTDDGTLVLDCAASSFLCDFLYYNHCQPCPSIHLFPRQDFGNSSMIWPERLG
jgi:hypothetical protein